MSIKSNIDGTEAQVPSIETAFVNGPTPNEIPDCRNPSEPPPLDTEAQLSYRREGNTPSKGWIGRLTSAERRKWSAQVERLEKRIQVEEKGLASLERKLETMIKAKLVIERSYNIRKAGIRGITDDYRAFREAWSLRYPDMNTETGSFDGSEAHTTNLA